MSRNAIIFILPAVLLLLALRCKVPEDREEILGHEHLLEVIEEKSHEGTAYDFSRLDYFPESRLIEVEATLPGVAPFYTVERKSQLASFACVNCHSQPLSQLQQGRAADQQKAHWDITVDHAPTTDMQCNTCHHTDDLNQLRSFSGNVIDFDHSYRLCGQCHSTQFRDWQGGSHGKQLGGWAPPRVSQTCVGCHNPHQPAFGQRLPARLNTVILRQRKE